MWKITSLSSGESVLTSPVDCYGMVVKQVHTNALHLVNQVNLATLALNPVEHGLITHVLARQQITKFFPETRVYVIAELLLQ